MKMAGKNRCDGRCARGEICLLELEDKCIKEVDNKEYRRKGRKGVRVNE